MAPTSLKRLQQVLLHEARDTFARTTRLRYCLGERGMKFHVRADARMRPGSAVRGFIVRGPRWPFSHALSQ